MSLKDFQDARLMGSESAIWSEHYRQARILWDKGFGKAVGYDDFEHYLASIPPISMFLFPQNEAFPHLVLVEGRLDIKNAVICSGLKPKLVEFDNGSTMLRYPNDNDPRFPDKTKKGIRWMRCNIGFDDRFDDFKDYSGGFFSSKMALDIVEGVALFAQWPVLFDQTSFGFLNSSRSHDAYEIMIETPQGYMVDYEYKSKRTVRAFPHRPKEFFGL